MPRRKSVIRPAPRPRVNQANYWKVFLENSEFLGPVSLEETLPPSVASQASQEEKPAAPDDLSDEQTTWINRVAEGMCPTEGVPQEYLIETREKQKKIREGLRDVMLGKVYLETWLVEARRMAKRSTRQTYYILYKSLEGLTSEEALTMREAYAQKLQEYEVTPNQALGMANG